VALSWRPGSQPQSLGYFSGDMKTSLAARLLMQYRLSMATQALLVLVHSTVTEREALPDLFLLLKAWLMALPTDAAPLSADAMVACGVLYLQLERRILEVIGYGLDLGRCALSGSEGPLAYVSPKTGRAASLKAASAYASQLFPLPACLVDASAPADREAIVQGLRITGHFLQRFFQEHRPHFSGLSLRDPWVQSW
jgi:DNA repair protein RecO (recombination protein O)